MLLHIVFEIRWFASLPYRLVFFATLGLYSVCIIRWVRVAENCPNGAPFRKYFPQWVCFKAICNMGLLFYIKNMQTVSVIGEKPLHATRGKNATTTGEIASGLTAYASDIAMH